MNAPTIRQAVIFAGGRGDRLRPLTDDRPKPMIPVLGRPFLEYLIDLLRENGITDVLLLLGYLPDKVMEYFGDGSGHGLNVSYHVTPVEDEAGLRLWKARHLLNDHFLALYCDNLWPLDLKLSLEVYQKMNAPILMTVYDNRYGGSEYGPYSNVAVGDDGYVRNYGERIPIGAQWGVDIGFFIIERGVVERISGRSIQFGAFTKELIPERRVSAFVTEHPYYVLTDMTQLARTEKFLAPKKAVFLDRDGTINRRMPPHEYVTSWEKFEFLPGAKEALAFLTRKGYLTFIATNQRGVNRGVVSMEALDDIHERMRREIAAAGGRIDGMYVCPHGEGECRCKKPLAGLLFQAAHDHHLDLRKACMIGDEESDVETGRRAGCKSILVGGKQSLLDVVSELP